MMAHEAELIIPGSFVCLQGSPGDGLRNFMSLRLPKLSSSRNRNTDDGDDDGVLEIGTAPGGSEMETDDSMATEPQRLQQQPLSNSIFGRPIGTKTTNITRYGTGLSSATTPSSSPFLIPAQQEKPNESITVVSDDQREAAAAVAKRKNADKRSINEWNRKSRETEREQREEWRETVRQIEGEHLIGHTMMDKYEEKDMWWQLDGLMTIFSDIPVKEDNKVSVNVIGTLSPGATVVATEIVFLDTYSFARIPIRGTALSENNYVYPKARVGWVQLIRLEHQGKTGYACLSVDGYWFLAPGLPGLYVDPHCWLWRVVCPAGAFVREGLELNTRHIDTLPDGSLVRVTRRTVNSQGLVRLQVQSKIDDNRSNKPRWIEGWCSEYLNPQSGQRGIVVLPLNFPVPALYRITLPIGAVIRSDIELSSPIIGVVPMGEVVSVVGRSFSEHPVDKCIERLQLAGNGGWISVRLNRPPPNDDLVVEAIGVDGKFDPDQPGTYHLDAQRFVQQNPFASPDSRASDISSIESDSSNSSEVGSVLNVSRHSPNHLKSDQCLICLTQERNATIVHGETGHVACCLVCARILKARGDKCPVCRLDIDLVIQHFWA